MLASKCFNLSKRFRGVVGFHIRLTRRRSPVRTQMKTKSLLFLLAEGRPSVDFCSRVAFPNRETVNEIKTIFVFISTVDCTFSNEYLHEKMYAFGQPK